MGHIDCFIVVSDHNSVRLFSMIPLVMSAFIHFAPISATVLLRSEHLVPVPSFVGDRDNHLHLFLGS